MLNYFLTYRENIGSNSKHDIDVKMTQLEILHARTGKNLATLKIVAVSPTILDVKREYTKLRPGLYADRQSYRAEQRGKSLKDEETLESLGITKKGKLYFKDLGPQIGWTTVFMTEYAGPLVVYLAFYCRPALIYGSALSTLPRAHVVNIAAACWTFHYAKRLFETVFVHRFSHGTMPLRNLFKNCAYYWGFTAFVSYFVNHPLYTSPAFGNAQIYGGLAMFILGELGNLSTHITLRNLRPPGTKERRIPRPDSNPLSLLFHLVSCPNYTYEALSWTGFSVMSQSLPAAIFMLAGLVQMSLWAIGKHKNYRHEFKDYPRMRKSIIPFIL